MKPSIPKEDINKVFHKINCLGQEINDLGRIIKIWEIIVNSIKKFKQLKYESFFGCIQNQYSLPLISINSIKISQGARSYIYSVLKEILGEQECSSLIKHSKIQDSLSELENITSNYKKYRNERHAHWDNTEISIIAKCDLITLFKILANLKASLNYITFYVLNFHYLIRNEWDKIKVENHAKNLLDFEEYFQKDPSAQDFNKIIDLLNEHKEIIC